MCMNCTVPSVLSLCVFWCDAWPSKHMFVSALLYRSIVKSDAPSPHTTQWTKLCENRRFTCWIHSCAHSGVDYHFNRLESIGNNVSNLCVSFEFKPTSALCSLPALLFRWHFLGRRQQHDLFWPASIFRTGQWRFGALGLTKDLLPNNSWIVVLNCTMFCYETRVATVVTGLPDQLRR